VKIERADAAAADQAERPIMMRGGAGAELTGEQAAAGDREPPQLYGLSDRKMEHVLFEASEVAPPGDHPGAARGGGKTRHIGRRPEDSQVMMEPVRRDAGDGCQRPGGLRRTPAPFRRGRRSRQRRTRVRFRIRIPGGAE
jgi:hypothetical protein